MSIPLLSIQALNIYEKLSRTSTTTAGSVRPPMPEGGREDEAGNYGCSSLLPQCQGLYHGQLASLVCLTLNEIKPLAFLPSLESVWLCGSTLESRETNTGLREATQWDFWDQTELHTQPGLLVTVTDLSRLCALDVISASIK